MKEKEMKSKVSILRHTTTVCACMLFSLLVFTYMGCSSDDDDKTVYTVTFDTDGGSPVPSVQRVEEGSLATAPSTNPIKAGYTFVYWHLTGASTAYNFQNPVKDDITLRAKWQEQKTAEYWQVTWSLNGGSWPSGDNHVTQVVKGGTLAEPAAPVKSGSTFDGWYKEAGLTNKVTFPYDVSTLTANFTLYAKWVDPATEYWKITWELNGGEWPSTGDNPVVQIEKGSKLPEPAAPVKAGSTFDGWYKEAAFTNKITFPCDVTGNLKLYAKWGDFTDDPNLKEAAYCLAYVYQVTEKKKQGQDISYISGVCSVSNWPNGTINYVSFTSHYALVPYLYNTPMVIGATLSSDRDIVYAARQQILDATYDYAKDPASIIAYFGTYSGDRFFSAASLGENSALGKLQLVANNKSITEDFNSLFPKNCYKILIFGKNKSGELIGKYIGFTLNGTSFSYWGLDPDDPKRGKAITIKIP